MYNTQDETLQIQMLVFQFPTADENKIFQLSKRYWTDAKLWLISQLRIINQKNLVLVS